MAEWSTGGLRFSVDDRSGVDDLSVKWVRGGVRFEYKTAKWDTHKHPRDRHGRFIRTGGHVRLASGVVGEVTGTAAGGKVRVRAGGEEHLVNAHDVAVVQGGATSKPSTPAKPSKPVTPRSSRAGWGKGPAPGRVTPPPRRQFSPGKAVTGRDSSSGLHGDAHVIRSYDGHGTHDGTVLVRDSNGDHLVIAKSKLRFTDSSDDNSIAETPDLKIDDRPMPEVKKDDRVLVGDNDGNERFGTVTSSAPAADGKHSVAVKYDDGATETHTYDARSKFQVVTGGDPNAPKAKPKPGPKPKPKPKPAPAPAPAPAKGGELKVDIADSQRKNIAAEFSTGDYPPAVKEAATRLGARQGLTVEHAEALAEAVRKAADNPDLTAARARSLRRGAERLDTVAAHLQGIRPEHKPSQEGVQKVAIGDITEGDNIALPGRGGTADLRRVVAARQWYGLHEVTLEDRDGNQETRFLTPQTDAYLLPGLPDPKPKPPGPAKPKPGGKVPPPKPAKDPKELVLPDQLNPGDMVQFGGEGTAFKVVSVKSRGALSWRVQYEGLDGTTQEKRVASALGLPNVVRVKRGPASESQSWDSALPEEKPTSVDGSTLKAGDHVHIPGNGGSVTGIIQSIDDKPHTGARILSIREYGGNLTSVAVGGSEKVKRLSEGSGDVAAQIQRERAAAEMRMTSAHLATAFAETEMRIRNSVLDTAQGELIYGDRNRTPDDLAKRVRAVIESQLGKPGNRRTSHSSMSYAFELREAVNWLAPGSDDAERNAYRERLDPLFKEIADKAHADAIEAVTQTIRNSRPPLGDYDINADPIERPSVTYGDAAAEALSALTGPAPRPKYRQAADALAQFQANVGGGGDGGDPAGLPEVPTPTEGELPKRMDAYRAALGGEFGKRRVQQQVFKATTLADLNAGKVPEVESVDAFVSEERVADGGPGEHAMAHLAIVRAAGKELDAEMQRRIDADMAKVRQEIEGYQRDEAKLRAENDRINELYVAAQSLDQNAYAQKQGFRDYADLDRQWRDSRWGSSEWKRLGDLRQKARKSASAKTKKLGQQHSDVMEKLMAIKTPQRVLEKREGASRRKHSIAMLDEVRKTGMGKAEGLTYLNDQGKPRTDRGKSGELVKAMRYAEAGYPTDWVEKAKGSVKLVEVNRGFYNHGQRKVALSPGMEQIGEDGRLGRVADHELGHRMEQTVPGLLAAQQAILWDRTSSGKIGSRTRDGKTPIYRGTSELGWKDDFPEHYTGKDYGNYAYEVFTTTKESLTSGSAYLDDDLRHWVLGVLALL